MEAGLKNILRGISLDLRHTLEGWHDKKTGAWNPGDLERRLNEIGAWGDRPSKPLDEMPHLSAEDRAARRLVDSYLQLRAESGVERASAVAEFVRESAYTWANRLFALRCMEARSIIEEVILQKVAYAGRSLVHQRYLRKSPDAAKGEDDGLFAVLFAEFAVRSQELPALFDPKSPAVALRPSVAALKRCVALLSGTESVRGQDPATDEVFAAPDAFGWAYQYWNADEKDRVFEMVRTKKGAKIEGADIIPATQLYTEPYMVRFLVQNSLGALWMGMYPDSKLCGQWEYFVKDAERVPIMRQSVREITFLDPAEGSGHFHLEAFDLFYAMYVEEATREKRTLTPREIAATILNHNLYGIDIDGRSVQIATAALWMKAKERAQDLEAGDLTMFHEHLVATNIRLPRDRNHLELFLQKHPEDEQLRPALEFVFQGLEHADELGALLQIEELVDAVMRQLKEAADKNKATTVQTGLFEPTLIQGTLPVTVEDYDKWKRDAVNRLQAHFATESQAADPVQAFFGESVSKGLTFFNVLTRRYDVVVANPPYMHNRNMGPDMRGFLKIHFDGANLDLYSAFIVQCLALCKPGGFASLVSQHSFMFVGSYAGLREQLLTRHFIKLIAHLGPGAFEEITGEKVNTALIVFQNCLPSDGISTFLRLVNSQQKAKDLTFLDRSRIYRLSQKEFFKVPGSPIVYWVDDALRSLFSTEPSVASMIIVANRTKTGDNAKFLRFIWEIESSIKWSPYTKGGPSVSWAGNMQYCVRWDEGARNHFRECSDCRITDEVYWHRRAITYSATSGSGFAARLIPPIAVYDVKGPALIPTHDRQLHYLLAYFNSRFVSFVVSLLNPTLEVQTGDIERIPFPNALQKVETQLADYGKVCLQSKSRLVEQDPAELTFSFDERGGRTTLRDWCRMRQREALREEFKITLFQSAIDKAIVSLVLGNRINSELADTLLGFSTPALRRIAGYEEFSELTDLVSDSHRPFILGMLQQNAIIQLDHSKLKDLRTAIRSKLTNLLPESPIQKDDDLLSEDTEDIVKLDVALPAESSIETCAGDFQIHPLSIYLIVTEGIDREGWRCPAEERRFTEDRFTVQVLRLLGHRWPKQLESGRPLPAWADLDGVIPLTSGGEAPLIERVRERMEEDFPGGNLAALEREFEEIIGVNLEKWLSGQFFERHISQFKKRPIAWQLETVANRQVAVPGGKGKKRRSGGGKRVFTCLVYYHRLDVDLLPKIRTQFVGPLRGRFETEFRTLERLANSTGDQHARRLQLEQWNDELQAFDQLLEDVSLRGFGPDALRPALRQYGIIHALLSLTASWLRRLSEVLAEGPLSNWVEAGAKTDLHPDFPKWLQDSMSHLDHFCAVLGPKPPSEQSFATDPTSKELAPLVCSQARTMVETSLRLGCDRWWKLLDVAVLEPLLQEVKTAKSEIEELDEELKAEGLPFQRRNEVGERRHGLKEKIKSIKFDHDEKSDRARKVRSQVERWLCPEAETWEAWLCAQPLFDAVTSLDGQRPPPQNIADFVAQESRYAPDINDGVRVNIAPIQKAGLLQADVLDSKDVDKAITDRAAWRADERRWVLEGKLPKPGWWASHDTEVHT
jgi:hypothetical protein